MSGIIEEMQSIVTGVVNDQDMAARIVYALIKQMGGDRRYIPRQDFRLRNQEIKDLYTAGASVGVLAKKYQLAERTVRRIIDNL